MSKVLKKTQKSKFQQNHQQVKTGTCQRLKNPSLGPEIHFLWDLGHILARTLGPGVIFQQSLLSND